MVRLIIVFLTPFQSQLAQHEPPSRLRCAIQRPGSQPARPQVRPGPADPRRQRRAALLGPVPAHGLHPGAAARDGQQDDGAGGDPGAGRGRTASRRPQRSDDERPGTPTLV